MKNYFPKEFKITLVFLLLNILLFSQNNSIHVYKKYDTYLKNARISDSLREYERAEKYFDSAFLIIDYLFYDYFEAFHSAVKNSNYEKATKFLIQGGKNGLDISMYNSLELDNFQKTQNAKDYNRIKDSLLEIHYQIIDLNYYKKLEELAINDQEIRDGSSKMKYCDSLNFEKLIELSTNKGFPTFKTTGNGCNFAFLILWHHRSEEYQNSAQWKRIIPLIQKEIDLENLDPNFLKPFDDFVQEK